MRCVLFVMVMGVVGVVRSRYAPTRDHSKDWLSLINGQQQLRDARIIYSILNEDPDFFLNKREHQGFDSSEKDFDGFQHPFYYVSHQKQQQEVEQPRGPFVFSRLGGGGPVDPSKAVLVDLPFRHRRLGDDVSEDLIIHDASLVPAESAPETLPPQSS
ncbi:uncharacterized protein LOC135226576 [Macrobrachium nipponense]|uniref:uncharacterized protein LOC135226576 n=1 Tax=Macrobrachium nipponense TaxID=159736 RepID=UPI0030C82E3A